MPTVRAGFLSQGALWAHAKAAHHSWSEYRKRLIFEVQRRQSVPLQPVEKRRLAGNFMQDLLHSVPGRNTVQPGKCTMRQIVACATCAVKDWIDEFYPCYLWKDAEAEAAGAAEHDCGNEESNQGSDDEAPSPGGASPTGRGQLLLPGSGGENPRATRR